MIRFGPAGIPLSCKGRTLNDGVKDVHNLSLTAIEAQLVRPVTMVQYPDDDYVGKTIKEVDDSIVLKILRDDEEIYDPDEIIDEDDEIVTMKSSMADNYAELVDVGIRAKRLDVEISLHTAKYFDLGSNNALTERCLEDILHAGQIANALGGTAVITNLGLYNKDVDREETDSNIRENLGMISEMWQEYGFAPKIGLEISERDEVFGSLDQILDLCDEFGNIVFPVLNFPNYHSRNNGCLIETSDFENIIQQVLPYNNGKLYAQFAGVEYSDNNDIRFTPIKKGNLKFELLADCLADSRPEATVISVSPLLEHDAMYMRVFYERMINKRVGKELRQRKKELEAAAAAALAEAAAAEPEQISADASDEEPEPEPAPKKKRKAPAKKAAEPEPEIDG